MFEKAAEEYLKKDGTKTEQILSLMQGEIKVKIKLLPFILAAFQQTYIDGAEFGYNKANEWHYVKDGLPHTSGRYLVYTGGEPFILDFDTEVNSFGYWVVSLGDDCGVRDEDFETVKDRGEDEVIAWKEIVLPELKESV